MRRFVRARVIRQTGPPFMIAVIDYNAGNLTSVCCAVRHLGLEPTVTQDPDEVRRADHVIFPGVGAAGASMETLRARGLDQGLHDARAAGKPILGICVGCQIIFTFSDENGGVDCLGLLPGTVERFRFPAGVHRKVPHMGWNEVRLDTQHPVLDGVPAQSQFYFVHSYHVRAEDPDCVIGTATYGEVDFTAIVARESLFAVQFHAEKSGPPGLRLLENFLRWSP